MDIIYPCYALGVFITGIFIAVDMIDQHPDPNERVDVDKMLLAASEIVLWPITVMMGLVYITRYLLGMGRK